MIANLSPFLAIFLLFIFLCQTYYGMDTPTFTCELEDGNTKVISVQFTDPSSMNYFSDECSHSENISIQGQDTLIGDKLDYQFFAWLFTVSQLRMCVSIEDSNIDTIDIVCKSFKGSCKGPMLKIVNNNRLVDISFSPGFVAGIKDVPNAVRVRGNRKMDAHQLYLLHDYNERINGQWDLQASGECGLPKPFSSFEALDRECTNFYGSLLLEQEKEEIQYNPLKVHSFRLEGCIQIENTMLNDITFLMAFANFTPIPFCPQFIRNNRNLCSRNLDYLNVFFKTIEISNNSQQCSECIGGEVSEYYLDLSTNCTHIYGDLTIANFRGLPPNVDNLRDVEKIQGRLIIINNTGLNKFDKLSSLKSVGESAEDGAAIIIENNADLTSLPLPNLMNIAFWKDGRKVKLVNNPTFFEESEETLQEEATTRSKEIPLTDQEAIAAKHNRRLGYSWMVAVALLLFLIALLE